MWAILAGAVVLAAVLRLPFLGHQRLWFDETYTRDILGEPTLGLHAFRLLYIQAPAPRPLALPGAVAFPAR